MLAPRQLPDLGLILDDLRRPGAAAIARHLGITENTFYRWQRGEPMPRPAHLALFWETSYGQSVQHCQAVNTAAVYKGLADSLQRENAGLRTRIAYLERVGRFDTANAPIFSASYA